MNKEMLNSIASAAVIPMNILENKEIFIFNIGIETSVINGIHVPIDPDTIDVSCTGNNISIKEKIEVLNDNFYKYAKHDINYLNGEKPYEYTSRKNGSEEFIDNANIPNINNFSLSIPNISLTLLKEKLGYEPYVPKFKKVINILPIM